MATRIFDQHVEQTALPDVRTPDQHGANDRRRVASGFKLSDDVVEQTSGMNQMLPACMSPWNGPCTHTASIQTFAPHRSISSPSMPWRAISSNSSSGVPVMRSMQMTRGPQWSQ